MLICLASKPLVYCVITSDLPDVQATEGGQETKYGQSEQGAKFVTGGSVDTCSVDL